jgi:hypothetical protein
MVSAGLHTQRSAIESRFALEKRLMAHMLSISIHSLVRRASLASLLFSAVTACSSDDGSEKAETSGEPTYLAALATPTADSATTYTVTTPAIDGTIMQYFLKHGLEVDGWASPSSYDGSVFVPHGAEPSITKFTVAADGTLEEGDTVSFAGEGVTYVETGPLVGETLVRRDKAYLFDSTLRAIVWNPERMELSGQELDFSASLKAVVADAPGYSPQIFVAPGFVKQVGKLMFVPVRWQNWSAETPDKIIYPLGGLLILDTERDEVVRLLTDPRIIDTIYTVVSDAGDLYLFTGAFGASFNAAFGLETPAGVLKIRNGESEFDPDYYLNLEERLGGRPGTTPSAGRGTEVYLKAFYEEEADMYDAEGNVKAEIVAEPWSLLSSGWRYWRIDLEEPDTAQVIEELPWGGTDGYFYRIPEEDRLFLAVLNGAKGTLKGMTLYEAEGATFTESISVPGTLQALARLSRK